MESTFRLPSFFHEVVLCIGAGCGAAVEVFTLGPMTDFERTNYVCAECNAIGNDPPPQSTPSQPPLRVERRHGPLRQTESLF